MAFEPENPLENALVQAAHDAAARPLFYRLLMSANLIVPGSLDRTVESGAIAHLRAGDSLEIPTVRHNGRSHHPIFSSLKRLATFALPEMPYFTATGRYLFSCTTGANFVLNPKSEFGKQLLASEIGLVLAPSASWPKSFAQNASNVFVRVSDPYPTDLARALSVLFRNRSDVNAAYIVEVTFPDRAEPPHPLIAIDVARGWENIYAEVSEISAAILPNLIIDVVPLDPTQAGDPLTSAILATEPIYARQQSE
jgi:hypothetical protein